MTQPSTLDFERVRLTLDDGVAVLALNHVEVLNALSPEMLGGIASALDVVEDDARGVRCLVLTGEGRAFCTGANLQGRGRADADAPPLKRRAGVTLETHFHPVLRRLRDLHCPIVSAVNGPAAGAGMSVALMGDLVFASASAYFLQAFRRIGLVPDCGSTWLLPRLIGRARALELSLLGEKLPARTALEWGLVNRVVDDERLMPEALGVARNLADGPTVALALTRQLYWESPDRSYEDQLDLEARLQRRAGATDDFAEGVQAFLAKRPARFAGR
ncbi:MAG TPA: enoyl-CoA hydratase/isomerase [Burkholderiaceae bacterium]|nr:enoyl-CoA hydratase/isomerase [Burkholderiaceae bacterium]